MKLKTTAIFIFSMALCAIAASYKFRDSAHAIGMLRKGGGTARHPVKLDPGRDAYTLIVTASVIPPYRGNARVVLEGRAQMDYTICESRPVIPLNFHHQPVFRDNTLYNLRPRDHIALWVRLKQMKGAHPVKEGTGAVASEVLCSKCETNEEEHSSPGLSRKTENASSAGPRQRKGLTLVFHDTVTNEALLRIPISFRRKGGEDHDI